MTAKKAARTTTKDRLNHHTPRWTINPTVDHGRTDANGAKTVAGAEKVGALVIGRMAAAGKATASSWDKG